MKMLEVIKDNKIKEAPTQSGCYIFKDKHSHVIYVGKAKNIRNSGSEIFKIDFIRPSM